MKQSLVQILENAVRKQVFPGAALCVVERDGCAEYVCAGRLTYENDSSMVSSQTIYDAASLTKVIPTSTLALIALERGAFSLDTPLVRYVPELAVTYAERVCIRHLLTHTLDFGFRLSSLKNLAPEELLDTILHSPLTAPPGEKFFYSNATSILLGMAIERALDKSLAALARAELLTPLGMGRSWIGGAPAQVRAQTAPSEIDVLRGREIRGETHDETAWKLRSIMTPGSAGLFTCAEDCARFLAMILAGGTLGTRRILREDTVQSITVNQIELRGESTGLGWEMNQPKWMGAAAARLIGKTGFTGCMMLADITRGRGVVLLTNWTWPHRRAGRDEIDRVRAMISDCVF